MSISQYRRYPQDIIDAIVEQLHGDPTALKQCALTATAFGQTSQKHLFRTINLVEFVKAQIHCQRLHETLTESPHLGSFIRELYVKDSPAAYNSANGFEMVDATNWMARDANFVALLSMLPNLRYLTISSFYGLDWKVLPQAVRSAVLNALGCIPVVKLSNVRNFPVSQFQNFVGLRNLTFESVEFDYGAQSLPVAVPHRGHLDALQFTQESQAGVRALVEQLELPTSSLTISQLRQLTIAGSSPDMLVTVASLLEASSCTLKTLIWQMNAVNSSPLAPALESFDLGAVSELHRLSLIVVVKGSPAENAQLQWLARNFASAERGITTNLAKLDLRLTLMVADPFGAPVESISDHAIWSDLDAALAAPRYSNLKRICFYVNVYGWKKDDTVRRSQLSSQLAQKMPLLNEKGTLTVFI